MSNQQITAIGLTITEDRAEIRTCNLILCRQDSHPPSLPGCYVYLQALEHRGCYCFQVPEIIQPWALGNFTVEI